MQKKVLERLEKIELQLATRKETVENSAGTRPRPRSNQRKAICWRCRKATSLAPAILGA